MIRFFKVVFVFIMSLAIFSCNKEDDEAVAPYIVPYTEQYPKDLAAIETYLKTHSATPVINPGFPDDQDVAFASITAGSSNSIWGSDPLNPKPSLLHKIVNSNGVDYKVYYISLREGTNEKPTKVDSASVSYKGMLLDQTVFDQAPNPVRLNFNAVIQGWREIIPLFKSGIPNTTSTNGTVGYDDFGAGVMFLPSGLAYYNSSSETIPSYSPLIFSFKLMQISYTDQDGDKIDSKYEDINGDNDPTNDDTDGDGIADYLDIDDDGDGYSTISEIKISSGGYYSFANIPLCSDGKKRHLSSACH